MLRRRAGFTILDMLVTVTIIGILSAIAYARAGKFLDGIEVHSAANDAFAAFSAARHFAIMRAAQSTLDIDTARRTLVVRSGQDTLIRRDLGSIHGVKLAATRTSITYAPTGIGYGVANLTLVIRRNAAIDSIVVSRLGRVRH